MIKIKSIRLKNYCGYRDTSFDFTLPDGSIKHMSCFFGPNGCGKSTVLNAVEIMCNAYRYHDRDLDLFFRKLVYHPDYDPTYASLYEINDMEMQAIFTTDDGDKEVIITNRKLVKNELPQRERMSFHCYTDADNPMNLYKFQLHAETKDRFLDLAKTVYGFECDMGAESPDLQDGNEFFFCDFIIKKHDTKVHFKRMSDGEKKIATLLRDLCNPTRMDMNDIILIDNIEMHIYKDRHAKLITKILEIFPTKQFLVTTHSPILVGMKDESLGLVIPAFMPESSLYDIEKYKEKEYTPMV